MPCDLERIYGDLAARLPDDTEHAQPFVLDESIIPAAPAAVSSDNLFIRRGQIQRLPGCRGDQLDIIAPRSTFRHLGLLALAVLFHQQCDRTTIHVTNPESRVKYVVLEHKHWTKSEVSGFRVRPWVLAYVPAEVTTFSTESVGFGAPLLRLTNSSDCQNDEHDWQNRDTLWGIGGTFATAEVAEFLLNAGRNRATLGHFLIPANSEFFAAEIGLWVPESWEHLQRTLTGLSQQHPRK